MRAAKHILLTMVLVCVTTALSACSRAETTSRSGFSMVALSLR